MTAPAVAELSCTLCRAEAKQELWEPWFMHWCRLGAPLVRGEVAEAHGIKVGAGQWHIGSPVPACLRAHVAGRGRRM